MDGAAAVRRQKFFKILLPGSSFQSSLSLPPKFAARLDRPPGLAIATLRDPAGRSWHVDLDGHGGAADPLRFEGRGWRSFVAGCGLSAGQLLVFDHLGGLDFDVEPFDISGCSSTFFDGEHGERATANPVYIDATADVESGSNNNNHHAPPFRSPPPASARTKKKRKRSPPTTTTSAAGSCERPSNSEGGDDGTLRLTIEQPFHLSYMELTKAFCDRVGWAESCTAELSVAGRGGDRRWEVSVRVGAKGGMIMAGWEGFAWDNGLRISDACVFTPAASHTAAGDQVAQVIKVIRGSSSSS